MNIEYFEPSEDDKSGVVLDVNGVVTGYESIEALLGDIQVNFDAMSVCLTFQGKARWVLRNGENVFVN